jgi:hypothetical protein
MNFQSPYNEKIKLDNFLTYMLNDFLKLPPKNDYDMDL